MPPRPNRDALILSLGIFSVVCQSRTQGSYKKVCLRKRQTRTILSYYRTCKLLVKPTAVIKDQIIRNKRSRRSCQ